MKKIYITINCSGCNISFSIERNYYNGKKRWGKSNFYHNNDCRIKSLKKNRKKFLFGGIYG